MKLTSVPPLYLIAFFLLIYAPRSMAATDEESMLLKVLPLILSHGSPSDETTPAPEPSWWQPTPGTSWQIQFTGRLDRSVNVEMYDVDLHTTSQDTMDQLHNDGRIVICYFSAGTWEQFRPDSGEYPESILGDPMDGWDEERWIDYRQIDILGPILEARMDQAVQKGCDGIDPDNVNGYTHTTGFSLTAASQITFNQWLAKKAHDRKLSIGLKNNLSQIKELVDHFDWALNESCFHYSTGSAPECSLLLPFTDAGKAVFSIEYSYDLDDYCTQAKEYGLSYIKKNWSLDAWRQACP